MEVRTAETSLLIDEHLIKKGAQIIRAINHPLRQQMLRLIHKHTAMTVTSIYVKLRLEQSVASQHLAILRTAGFVLTKRNSKYIFYSVNYERLDQLHTIVKELVSR